MLNDTASSAAKARVAAASVWSGFNQATQALVGVASVVLLSQWLAPTDYGQFAMAATATSLLGVVGDSGIVAALMRRRELDDVSLATGFWLALAGATVLSVLSALVAPLIGRWFGDTRLAAMAAVLATNFLIAAPSRAPTAKLIREMRFRTLAVINVASNAVSLLVAIALARAGAGAWSLVTQYLGTFGLQAILGMLFTKAPITWRAYDRAVARELRGVGFAVGGYGLSVTTARALDPLLGGRYLGSSAFGLIGMGSRIVNAATIRAAGALAQVFLPALASMERAQQKASAFVRALRLTLLVVLPIPVGIATIGPELMTLLPRRWSGVQSVLPLLAGVAALEPVNMLSVAVITSTERNVALVRLSLLLAPLGWATAFMGAQTGCVSGFATWMLYWALAQSLGLAWIVSSSVCVTMRDWIRTLGIVVPILAMAIVVRVTLRAAQLSGSIAGLGVGICTGGAAYAVLTWLLARSTVQELRTFVTALLRRNGRSEHSRP